MAFYKFDALETLLRRAEQIDLAITGLADEDFRQLRDTFAADGVSAEIRPGTRATLVRLRGRQDAMGLRSRHGWRVARAACASFARSEPRSWTPAPQSPSSTSVPCCG